MLAVISPLNSFTDAEAPKERDPAGDFPCLASATAMSRPPVIARISSSELAFNVIEGTCNSVVP